MLILSRGDLHSLLTMRDVIAAVEGAFLALARGDALQPERLRLELPEARGVLLEMPSYLRGHDALGTKIVSVFPGNAALGLDIVQAVYLLLDSGTGAPLAIMEGRFITAIRTAATSAVATKYLSNPGAARLAVFGAGVQAEYHVEAMAEVRVIEEVMISSRTERKALSLAGRVRSCYGVPCEVVRPDEAARRASLVCACTSSNTPLFDGELIARGAHINAVGTFSQTARELDTAAVSRARVFIDSESAAGREAGEILIPLSERAIPEDHVKGTLSDLVSGKVAGRISPDDVTLFKSSGLAIEDLVTARLAYSLALDRGVGSQIDL